MVAKTTMSGTTLNGTTMNGGRANGLKSPSAAAGASRHASAVLHDAITLAELQCQLLSADYRESKRRFTTAAVAMLLGVLLLIAALPVALLALADVLVSAGFSAAAAHGLAALAATVVASVAALIGWRLARSAFAVFARSRDEFVKNLETLRCLLGSREGCLSD